MLWKGSMDNTKKYINFNRQSKGLLNGIRAKDGLLYVMGIQKQNEDILDKLKIKPVILTSKLSEEMEGKYEQNEYRKSPKTNLVL
jgi:hypothetical protein